MIMLYSFILYNSHYVYTTYRKCLHVKQQKQQKTSTNRNGKRDWPVAAEDTDR